MPGNTHKYRKKTMKAVDEALVAGGYRFGSRRGGAGVNPLGRGYNIARVVRRNGREFAISIQHQDVRGTAEQKVAHHVMCLGVTPGYYRKYLVLGGGGFSSRATNVVFNKHIVSARTVRIMPVARFLARCRKGIL